MNRTIVAMICARCSGPIVNQFVPKGQEPLHDDPLVCIEWLRSRAESLAAEVERLTAEKRGYRDDWLIERELAQLNIEYDGGDPLQRLVEEVAALRAQLVAREHAACPHCGQSLHGERLLPF